MDYYNSYSFKEIHAALVGKRIIAYTLGPGGEYIIFQTDVGPVRLITHADCCSNTWIESLDDGDALLGTVQNVEEIPMFPAREEVDAWDVIRYYGLKITTDRGRCVIDYRNSSNGYYGGSLELAEYDDGDDD